MQNTTGALRAKSVVCGSWLTVDGEKECSLVDPVGSGISGQRG